MFPISSDVFESEFCWLSFSFSSCLFELIVFRSVEEDVEFVDEEDSDDDEDADDEDEDGFSKFSLSSKFSDALSVSASISSGYSLSREDKLFLLLL